MASLIPKNCRNAAEGLVKLGTLLELRGYYFNCGATLVSQLGEIANQIDFLCHLEGTSALEAVALGQSIGS